MCLLVFPLDPYFFFIHKQKLGFSKKNPYSICLLDDVQFLRYTQDIKQLNINYIFGCRCSSSSTTTTTYCCMFSVAAFKKVLCTDVGYKTNNLNLKVNKYTPFQANN